MSLDALIVMMTSITLLWGGLGYFIFRFIRYGRIKKGQPGNVIRLKKYD
ncbi:hypothetical protein JOC94_000517 [Bacillus thermophilus]|uniref:MetS family NSS transporter small subunit n=1 Tax=Siminovitchia thermophila TaxID=1245522 RepID=A0ABS2R1V2_9BACI|nr:hypothetical protein [Siminovitchia thermophila]